MKKLINNVLDVVPEALSGFARCNGNLALLEGWNTIVRADLDAFRASGKVAIVTGGGAGHEPAHAGYVGQGMLTAAVSGDVFASPSSDAVLAALRAVAGPAGVLLIVKNYTGDRLNFGLAAEIAQAEGIPCALVVVDDDAALGSDEETAGRRGIAGTVFVHKVAGAAAEAGLSLDQVRDQTLAAIGDVASMGVALSSCTVPAAGKPNFELGDDEVELGLGIHGEPGVVRENIRSARATVETLVDKIIADRQFAKGEQVALLVNNLGATPPMEMSIVANDALDCLEARGLNVARCWSGTYLTSIDMAGISLSLMRVNSARLKALDAATSAPSWPRQTDLGAPSVAPVIPASKSAQQQAQLSSAPPVPALGLALSAACAVLIASEPMLTEMDQAVGDGDIGRSLSSGAEAILNAQSELEKMSAPDALHEIGMRIREAVGGTSGPLYAILAMRAAHVLSQPQTADTDQLSHAFSEGVEALMALGGAKAGDCTMVDALLPAATAMRETKGDAVARLAAAAKAAQQGAESTSEMIARRGRTSYLGARAKGRKDPGAEAVALWLKAASDAINKP